MAFCSFSGDYDKNGVITVDTSFITEYLPEASGDAVKVFIYGLYLCRSEKEISLADFSAALSLTEAEVKDCFKFWEEYNLVAIISDEPLAVRYLPMGGKARPRKYKPEKYTDFSNALQALFPARMISVSEFTAYFDVMEAFKIKPEAMLMICNYCIDLKGESIGYRYIVTVAKDFAYRGIVTPELIEQELADYNMRGGEITDILNALGLKRKPEVEDLNLLKKWKSELGYEQSVLLFIAKKCKRKAIDALDAFISELYGNKLFTESEISDYLKKKDEYIELAKNVCKNLSVYVQDVTPVVTEYVSPWLAKGFDGDTLEFLANYCFKKNRRTLADLDEQINRLYDRGLITLSAIADYVKNAAKLDEFIRELFGVCTVNRRPTDWDRQTVSTWQNWGFSDEMIKRAVALSVGTARPMVYTNAILSDWKSKGIFTPDKIPAPEAGGAAQSKNKTVHFENEREYTKEQLDSLVQSIDDIEF
ncbi:MAG: DnaD domain protein [Candidatus Borkfalkiaceae bacterium]|nr:DnaD domain protein [Christensenellaceae bacterium]